MHEAELVVGGDSGVHELPGEHSADVRLRRGRHMILLIGEIEDRMARILQEPPVPDEMQNVDSLAQSRLERRKRARIGEADELHAGRAVERLLQELPLGVGVDRSEPVVFEACGIGDRRQDADRPLENGTTGRPLAGQVA